ncbi:hypothetical protein EYF80_021039 [Liparis tanakae]|uniref:Uncharacterized protein n=1 Tax=Liparis tanakae TaxID=230148 RepID=A0A4Z2HSP1_9TELE|nr:hypothetical protein EYF80_021039 [Liparis tanakae]
MEEEASTSMKYLPVSTNEEQRVSNSQVSCGEDMEYDSGSDAGDIRLLKQFAASQPLAYLHTPPLGDDLAPFTSLKLQLSRFPPQPTLSSPEDYMTFGSRPLMFVHALSGLNTFGTDGHIAVLIDEK